MNLSKKKQLQNRHAVENCFDGVRDVFFVRAPTGPAPYVRFRLHPSPRSERTLGMPTVWNRANALSG